MAEDYKLIDNEEKHRYEFQIDGKIAEIDYIKLNNGEIYLVHTEVPASLGGKGVGSQLAEKALTDIERQGLRLVPVYRIAVHFPPLKPLLWLLRHPYRK